MKPYPPTLREKKRYLVFKVVGERRFSAKEVKDAVLTEVYECLGVVGTADAGFKFMGFDEAEQEGVVKTTLAHVLRVRAALALLANINKYRAFIQVVRVCGSLKKTRERR